MTSAAKLQKDKLYGSTPRLAPRATAASMARAARNATNRSSTSPALQKAPSITTSSISKAKSGSQRGLQSEPTLHEKVTKKCSESIIPNAEPCDKEEDKELTQQEPEEVHSKTTNDTTENDLEETNIFEGESFEQQEICDQTIKMVADDDNKIQNYAEINEKPEYEKTEIEPTSKSSSRPQTPKSKRATLSRTPGSRSRPVTPAKPLPRTTPVGMLVSSRPNTPRKSCLPRPKTTPSSKSPDWQPTAPNKSTVTNTINDNDCAKNYNVKKENAIKDNAYTENAMTDKTKTDYAKNDKLWISPDDITAIFNTKQNEFHCLKKELDLKQDAILEKFNALQALRNRLIKEGKSGDGEGWNQQELVIFNVADWAAEEVAQLCRNSDPAVEGSGEIINTIMPIDEDILSEWEGKVSNLPASFADLCLQAFTARQEVIDWVKEIISNQDAINEADLGRITIYNEQGLQLCDLLRELKSQADDSLHGVTQLLKQACQERGILITVGESLVKEVARLRQDILHTAVTMGLNAIEAESDTTKALEDTRRELEEERAAKLILKDKLTTVEAQLRQSRIRVNKMDRQLREAEASIASLTMTVKSLEDQSRQKEVQLEARARKLKESLKTGEMTNNHIVQQREKLQDEVSQLREQLERNAIESKLTLQEMNNQLKELKVALEIERNNKLEEIERKTMFEDYYRENLKIVEELKAQIIELENNKPNPDLPTEREMELGAELLATKDTMRVMEEEMIACKREKVRFLETLSKIAESDNKMGMQQKLASELLSKEEIMTKMQTQMRELTKNIKFNEQKVLQYEQYVRDTQAYCPGSVNFQESPNDIAYHELQQEIMNLRLGLLEAIHKNEELMDELTEKDQQLEQQNTTSRSQARIIKVREELINMLKNKETEQGRELSTLQQDLEHRMKIVDEVNKQIAAKADEIQELFSTLENKQQQIHRLEKIVMALEEQQRRAQAQRTRHEEKIAALEHELHANGIRRERKFLFF